MPPAPFEWTWGSRSQGTPVVELTVGGRTRHANLFADLPFGEAGGPVSEIRERDEPEEVEVSLSAATPGDREEPIELVAGEWSLPELLGRQLLVRTTPLVEPHENPTARIGDLDVFGDFEGLIGDLLGVGNDTVGAMGGSTPISCSIPL